MYTDFSKVRGFNYQPSYGCTNFENWLYFKPDVVADELKNGKRLFPGMNTVRLWLDLYAYQHEPNQFVQNFETALSICDSLGLKVMVVLFNRWHDQVCDCGGIYYNHFLPVAGFNEHHRKHADNYIESVVGAHAKDERIIAWDICNEPFTFGGDEELGKMLDKYEAIWMREHYAKCKQAGATQPVTFSPTIVSPEETEKYDDISDVYLIHPYFFYSDEEYENTKLETCVSLLKDMSDLAKRHKKQICTTETCWGSMDDNTRVGMIRITMEAHREVGMGWIAHALYHSRVADLHDATDGPIGVPGNLAFVRKDGTIRPGHEIINEYF